MNVTVLILWPSGRSSNDTWNIEHQGERRTMAKEINTALAEGAAVISSCYPETIEEIKTKLGY